MLNINNKQELFKLLEYLNELRKKNKYLYEEDFKKYEKLLKFSVVIETNLHLRQKYK